ncbi:flagellar hook-associated protein 2 [Salipaludibacillus aurantiacus]|uniref:Flagellar hook-associated protein 2 n=1 Tax=Salipaludibacillus aurantiacus TaxID=1601833 RepID=A0A1H9WXY3_9BACI|nr:flagellar hook-associated protein 2 [Salipaludibacillus aurantiacus]SES38760.1 flagellar hook-associated protein 2 [Salipaludibacillus aurantiacus]
MRLSGFASGMDINQMVGDLMQAERQPLQKMQQDQQELVLKMADYREVNREFMQFRNNTFDSVIMASNMDAKEVTSSNGNLVSGYASAGAANSSYTISDVERAQSAYNFSDGSIVNEGAAFDPGEGLIGQAEALQGNVELNADGKIEFGMTTFDEQGEAVEVSFTFDENDSLNDMLSEINRSELGVQAFYDDQSQRISMSRTETGIYNTEQNGDGYHPEIVFGTEEGASGEFLTEVFNLDEANESAGRNASFTFNGMEMERQSNQLTINGLNISLNDEFTDPVTISVANNTDDIFDTVMGFVEEYNELIEMVGGKVSEEYYRDYAPLTDEQRREMSESEIELWEERAHSGLLRNDRMLTGALNQMRQDFYTPVDGAAASFTQVAEIGITTTSNYQDGGRLEVDEAQLRAAIEEDPQAVHQLFAADGEQPGERGIARRIRDTLAGSIEQIGRRAGRSETASNQQFTLGREIDQAEDRISNFERRMQQVEERYWKQFTAMEQAMARANAQAEQLMSHMGGLMGGGQQM